MKPSLYHKFQYAWMKTIPVMCGYIFLGIAFGISLQEVGFGWVWAFLISLLVYAGSLQFVMIPMLASQVSLMTMAVTALFVNCRHIFYGISFVDSFTKMKEKLYMIFSLTDETYSVLCGCKTEDPEETHRDSWFLISAIDHGYWVLGSVIGGLLGNIIPFDLTGIDFSMTALFVVILLEKVLGATKQTKMAATVGGVVSTVFLLLLGIEKFLLPSLLITVFILSAACAGDRDKKEGESHV